MSDTFERIKTIIVENLDSDPDKVTSEARLIDDLGADSLDNVELIMAAEEVFDIRIEDAEAEDVKTVGDIVKLVEQKLLEAA